MSETSGNSKIDEVLVARILGKDRINTCDKYENPIPWLPAFCMNVLGNNYMDYGRHMIGKVKLFEMNTKFVSEPKEWNERQRDSNIFKMWEKAENKEALLSWVIQGSIDYYREGIKLEQEEIESGANEDPLITFLEYCTDFGPGFQYTQDKLRDETRKVSAAALYNLFKAYYYNILNKDEKSIMSQTNFSRQLYSYLRMKYNCSHVTSKKAIMYVLGVKPIRTVDSMTQDNNLIIQI